MGKKSAALRTDAYRAFFLKRRQARDHGHGLFRIQSRGIRHLSRQ